MLAATVAAYLDAPSNDKNRDALQGRAPRIEGEVYGEYPIDILKHAIDKIPAWTDDVIAAENEHKKSDP